MRETHRRAMTMADEAMAAERLGMEDEARELFEGAWELEYKAAKGTKKEPGRSILHRSAATLALRAKDIRAAHEIAFQGLRGDAPKEIQEELQEIFRQTGIEDKLWISNANSDPEPFRHGEFKGV